MITGIIGSGAMGTGIAQVLALAGHEVMLYDKHSEALQKASQNLQRHLNRMAEKGKISDAEAKATFGRVYIVEDLSTFVKCKLVIEAIIENLEIKKSIFSQLEEIVNSETILATNTSSLSIASIASACQKPSRVLGIHFFNPAPLMKLVEIIPAVQTDKDILRKAKSIIEQCGKLTVVAKDTPGFIVNRVARPFYGEALRVVEEDLATPATVDWAMTELGGFRMGPFTLMDYIGHDVNYAVTESVFEAFYYDPRYQPSFVQKRMVEAGYLGRKSGRGFYDYAVGTQPEAPQKNKKKGTTLMERIVIMLINEAADALYLKIATRDDIDLAMTKGVNYPKGLLAWADEWGIKTCVKKMDRLYDLYRSDRYRCSPILRYLADKGKTFY